MNINKVHSGVSSFERNETIRQTSLMSEGLKNAGQLESEAVKPDESQLQNLPPRKIPKKPEIEGLQRFSPLDQYRYMDGQEISAKPTTLRVVPGNPQKTLSVANQVINDALMPPVFANPNRNRLTEALQIKRMAENIIDKAA